VDCTGALDCTGAAVGVWRVFEPLELFGEFGLLDELELAGELELPEEPEPLDDFEVFEVFGEPVLSGDLARFQPEPVPAAPLSDDPPVLAGVLLWVAACEAPGSTMATAPAATTLAKPTVAVAAFSRRLPRSRSATACETWRAAARARADGLRSSQLSMFVVCHA
jgi:hypothetical protein